MSPISATFHRVSSKTKPPYLARVNGFGKRDMQPMIILVQAVVINDIAGRPFARAIIVSSPSKYPDLTPGNTMLVDNFTSLSRMKLEGVPHSDS